VVKLNLLLFCVDFTWNDPLGKYGKQIRVIAINFHSGHIAGGAGFTH